MSIINDLKRATREGGVVVTPAGGGSAPSGGGVVWVQFTWDGETPTSDKTLADIIEALEGGSMVIGTDANHNLYYLSCCTVDDGADFASIPYISAEGVGQEYYTITTDGVTSNESFYPQNTEST